MIISPCPRSTDDNHSLSQINWPPEDYEPEDDEIAKVYTNGGKVGNIDHDVRSQ